MSRYDGTLNGVGEATLDMAELLAAFANRPGSQGTAERTRAIACYLALDDGWRQAGPVLAGAFAGDRPEGEHDRKE